MAFGCVTQHPPGCCPPPHLASPAWLPQTPGPPINTMQKHGEVLSHPHAFDSFKALIQVRRRPPAHPPASLHDSMTYRSCCAGGWGGGAHTASPQPFPSPLLNTLPKPGDVWHDAHTEVEQYKAVVDLTRPIHNHKPWCCSVVQVACDLIYTQKYEALVGDGQVGRS